MMTSESASRRGVTKVVGSVMPTATVTMPYLGAVVAKGKATWGDDGVGSGGGRAWRKSEKVVWSWVGLGWAVRNWLF